MKEKESLSSTLKNSYRFVMAEPLSMKGSKLKKKSKKKKKVAPEAHVNDQTTLKSTAIEKGNHEPRKIHKTDAEIAFELVKEIREQEQIKKQAAMSYRKRIDEFNEKIDKVTEHNN
mmetsp:Transcript_1100/g.1701  ORF Transcript_1100/g.1701 Transcript_1100/m.1701 type:complete len:116 (+) Transcript_1100:22-369(+)